MMKRQAIGPAWKLQARWSRHYVMVQARWSMAKR